MDQRLEIEELIGREYLAKNSIRQAFLNICNKIEVDNICSPIDWLNEAYLEDFDAKYASGYLKLYRQIENLYNKFRYAFVSIFDANANVNNGLISWDNGRFGFYFNDMSLHQPLQIVDVFHGQVKPFSMKSVFSTNLQEEPKFMVKMVDNERLLVLSKHSNLTQIYLVGIRPQTRQYKIFDCRQLKASPKEILFNEENRNDFLLIGLRCGHLPVELTDQNRIQLSNNPVKAQNLYWKKWEGQKFCGFLMTDKYDMAYYCEYDMQERQMNKVRVSMLLENEFDAVPDFKNSRCHVWSKKNLYVGFTDGHNKFSIYKYNLLAQKWSKLNFYCLGRITSLYVDNDEVLSIGVSILESPINWGTIEKRVYRLLVDKPDTLKNLCWSAIRRYSTYFGYEQLYQQALPCLPLNSGFVPIL